MIYRSTLKSKRTHSRALLYLIYLSCVTIPILISQTNTLSTVSKYLRKLDSSVTVTQNADYSICPNPKYYSILKKPTNLPEHCQGILLHQDFSNDDSLQQDSFLGLAELHFSNNRSSLEVKNRTFQWQGNVMDNKTLSKVCALTMFLIYFHRSIHIVK